MPLFKFLKQRRISYSSFPTEAAFWYQKQRSPLWMTSNGCGAWCWRTLVIERNYKRWTARKIRLREKATDPEGRKRMAETDDAVNVTLILTEQDLLRLTWTSLLRNKRLKIMMPLLGIFTLVMGSMSLCGMAQSDQPETALYSAPCLLFVPFMIFVFFPLSIWWSVRKAYRNNPNMQRETTYRFTAQGIESTNAVANTEVTWEAIIEILETKKAYLFYYSWQSAFMLPKTAIPSPDDRQRLRRLVVANAGDRAKLRAVDSPEDWSS